MFTASFWKTALEHALVAGATAFAAAFSFTGVPTVRELEVAGVAGAMGAFYAFVKQLGAVQAVKGTPKVAVKAAVGTAK